MGLKNELLEKERSYVVAKSNVLITKSRYSLTTQQHRLLLYMVSKIKPDDAPETEYTISIQDVINVCGYTECGYYYQTLKDDVQKIANVSVWIETEPGKEKLFRWIDTAELETNKAEFTITFHKTMRPYLFELKDRYVSFYLMSSLCLSHKYAMRLYEYLLAMRYRGEFEVSIDELKKRMDVTNETYNKMSNFKSRVFEPAVENINDYTELNIEYAYIKKGKRITHIAFRYLDGGIGYTITKRLQETKLNPERRKAMREFKKEVEQRRRAREQAGDYIQGEGMVTAQMTIDELAAEWGVAVTPEEGSATT